MLSNAQFGVRKGRSTETALLTLKEHVLENTENNIFTRGILIDFSKAFNHLNYCILLDKLLLTGIRGKPLALMKSYLSNRKQFVQLNTYKYCYLPVFHGVPQGRVLGPLLFNVHVNDIVSIDAAVKFVI